MFSHPFARLVAQILTALALLAGATVVAPATAQAVDLPTGTDCLHPPDPASPNGGLSGSIDPGPSPTERVKGDPFTPAPAGQPQPSIYDAYGYGGTTIVRFDDGCASAFNIWGDLANMGQGVSSVLVAVTTSLYRTIMSPSFGAIFEPLQLAAQNVVGRGLFLPFILFVMVAVGVYFMALAARADVKETLTGAGKMVLIVLTGLYLTLFPVTIGASLDATLSKVVSSVATLSSPDDDTHTAADAIAGNTHEAIVYNTWLQATFGPGELNAKVAADYGPRLFRAGAYTRDEQAVIDKDPTKAQELGDAKREAYKEAALEIKDKYPQVYEYIAGSHQDFAFGVSAAGVLGAFIAVFFLLVSLVKLGYSAIIVRLAIGAGPAIALVAAFPTMAFLAVGAAKLVLDALCKAAYFGVAAILFVYVGIGGILSPTTELNPVVKLFALGILTYAAWYGAKRFGLMADLEKAKQAGRAVKNRLTGSDSGVGSDPPLHSKSRFTAGEQTGERAEQKMRTKTGPPAPAAANPPTRGPRALPATAMHVTPQLPVGGKAAAAIGSTSAGAVKGGVGGAVKGIAATAATGGAAAPAAAAGAARGAVQSAVQGAARSAAGPTKAATGRVVFHPASDTPTQTGPPTKAAPSRRSGGVRVHNVQTTKARR